MLIPGESYKRDDVWAQFHPGIERPTGGSWDTGYVREGRFLIAFANIATAGRTGHDFPNRYDPVRRKMDWYGKPGTHSAQRLMQDVISGSVSILMFARENSASPKFEFLGQASIVGHEDGVPMADGRHSVRFRLALSDAPIDPSMDVKAAVSDDLMLSAINAEDPKVWIKAFWGFTPEEWGAVGFTDETARDALLADIGNIGLVLIYGSTTAKTIYPEERGRVLGLYAVTGKAVDIADHVDPAMLAEARKKAGREAAWRYAVPGVRAWRVPVEQAPRIADIAPETYDSEAGTTIARRGRKLSKADAQRILSLVLEERGVYKLSQVPQNEVAPLAERLRPSKAGPISVLPKTSQADDGFKHAYILTLSGDAGHFLDDTSGRWEGCRIVKVGISKHPSKRCDDINRNYPHGAYAWRLTHSTFRDGLETLFAPSAVDMENVLKGLFEQRGTSLGGEFFVIKSDAIRPIWSDLSRKWADLVQRCRNETNGL
jgi:hypothetical protein